MSQLYLKGVYYDTETAGLWYLDNAGSYQEISAGGVTIYTGDGSLNGPRTLDLNGNNLIISNALQDYLRLDIGDDRIQLENAAGSRLDLNNDNDNVVLRYKNDSTQITMGGGSSAISYTADTHTFNTGGGAAFLIDSGRLTAIVINDGGLNYVADDILTITGGDGNATAKVDTIDVNGVITGLSIVNKGSGYASDTAVSLTGGSGDGNATADTTAAQIGVSTNNTDFYQLGAASAGAPTTDSKIRVTINGVNYDIAAEAA